jgi:hypothetical protein
MTEESSNTEHISPRALPADYSWMVYRAAWRLLGVNYPLILVLFFILGFVAYVFEQIEFIGPILSSVVFGFLMPGVLILIRSIVENKTLPLRTLFIGIRNDDLMNRLIPYVVTSGAVTLGFSILEVQSSRTMSFFLGGLSLIWMILVTYSIPLIVFKKVRFFDTFDLNFQALSKNVGFIFLYIFTTACLAFAGFIALFLPLIFIVFPMILMGIYLLYAAVFENLELEKIQVKTEIVVPQSPKGNTTTAPETASNTAANPTTTSLMTSESPQEPKLPDPPRSDEKPS